MLEDRDLRLLRVTFDLLGNPLWWWGVVALSLGLVTALFGVIFAAVQTDMKRLLAYSSIENIGIIVAGIGLAVLYSAYGKGLLSAIAMIAVLYHVLTTRSSRACCSSPPARCCTRPASAASASSAA